MATASSDPLSASRRWPPSRTRATPRRRMLVIVNPYATTVSDRLKNLVVYALRGRYEVRGGGHRGPRPRHRAVPRRRRWRATTWWSPSAATGPSTRPPTAWSGPTTPLFCLPGGRTNVYCRILGIPNDVVDATEHLLGLAHAWHPRPRRRGPGQRALLPVLGRHRPRRQRGRAGRRPSPAQGPLRRVVLRLDRRSGPSTATTCSTRRGCRPTSAAKTVDGVTAIVQSAEPYTYFGDRPVHMGEGASLDSGDLAGVVLRRATVLDIPRHHLAGAVQASAADAPPPCRAVRGPDRAQRAVPGRPALPLQVDGDYIGEVARGPLSLARRRCSSWRERRPVRAGRCRCGHAHRPPGPQLGHGARPAGQRCARVAGCQVFLADNGSLPHPGA